MVTESVIKLDPYCCQLYAWLDRRQMHRSDPTTGFAAIARALGHKPATIAVHADHLAERGLITVDRPRGTKPGPKGQLGYRGALLSVRHNPARKRIAEDVKPTEAPQRYRQPSQFAEPTSAVKRHTSPEPTSATKRHTSPNPRMPSNGIPVTHETAYVPKPDVCRQTADALTTARNEETTKGYLLGSSGNGGGFGGDSEALEGEKNSTSPTKKNGTERNDRGYVLDADGYIDWFSGKSPPPIPCDCGSDSHINPARFVGGKTTCNACEPF